MANFFVTKKLKEQRLNICRACEFYFKPTGTCRKCGCFMRIKSSIAVMGCPIGKWLKVSKNEKKEHLPKYLIKEAEDIWEGIKTGAALNHEYKKRAIELHNTIYNTGYNTGTNCSSCLRAVRDGIKKIIDDKK
tara:strand:- start:991 stop:1389 length:399 start_codon:yes stop_codon:yes gene_type:complete